MAFAHFGSAFASNVLRKYYSTALAPAITNANYEGEIKKIGDRVNVLMFLGDISLNDYVVGTNMGTQHLDDTEAQLIVEKRKYFNFDIDQQDKQMIYVNDPESALIENAAQVLEREIDKYVLEQAYWVKAGNFVGINQLVVGESSETSCSILTTATGGTLTCQFGTATATEGYSPNKNIDRRDISLIAYRLGFGADVIGKPIRLVSQSGYATEWYRITAATASNIITIENWDSNVGTEPDGLHPHNDILYGLHGAGLQNADVYSNRGGVGASGWGYEIQAAIPTTLTSGTVYAAIAQLKEKLDDSDAPATDRMLIIPPPMMTLLLRAAELQTDIEMYHKERQVNGNVGRILGFDIHLATGAKISTRAGRSICSADKVVTASSQGHQVLACHKSFCTFAHKWTESRTVQAELQFANLYQGLNLYGAKVLNLRRKMGAQLFCQF